MGRRVLWDAGNRRQVIDEHPERQLTTADVESILARPAEPPVYLEHRDVWESIGLTGDGRWVVVAWKDDPEGMYPIHARPIGEKGLRRWRRRWAR
jgi:hypothetical protein